MYQWHSPSPLCWHREGLYLHLVGIGLSDVPLRFLLGFIPLILASPGFEVPLDTLKCEINSTLMSSVIQCHEATYGP